MPNSPLTDPRDYVAPHSALPADVAFTVTYGSVDIEGVSHANVDVYYKSGKVEKTLQSYADIMSTPSANADDDIGYHGLRASDL